jgi:hypothetical protein
VNVVIVRRSMRRLEGQAEAAFPEEEAPGPAAPEPGLALASACR